MAQTSADDYRGAAPVAAALFVDFDNVYLTLADIDRGLADRFATAPHRLVQAIENPASWSDGLARRVALRRCYLNPNGFAQFRRAFQLAGFSVIDCPSLTQQGKSAADMKLAIDVMKHLDRPYDFAEFIILSGDADFSPIVLELRERGKRTAIFGVRAAELYRVVADAAIDFVDFARIFEQDLDHTEHAASLLASELSRQGRMNWSQVLTVLGRAPGFAAANEESRWLGHGSAVAMMRAFARLRPDIRFDLVQETGQTKIAAVHLESDRPAAAAPSPAGPAPAGATNSPASGPTVRPIGPAPLTQAPLSPAAALQTTSIGSGPIGSGPMSSGPMSSGPVNSGPVNSGPVRSSGVESLTSGNTPAMAPPNPVVIDLRPATHAQTAPPHAVEVQPSTGAASKSATTDAEAARAVKAHFRGIGYVDVDEVRDFLGVDLGRTDLSDATEKVFSLFLAAHFSKDADVAFKRGPMGVGPIRSLKVRDDAKSA